MAAVTITLSDQQVTLAKTMADKEGFAGIEQYLQMLLTERLLNEADDEEDYGAPAHLRVSTAEQLKALIREGLESPAVEMTHGDFEKTRRELVDRHTNSRAG